MTTSTNLLTQRRFLPLFLTQMFNAFNDNLYKNAMVLFVVFTLYDSAAEETFFSGLASAVFILPFFLLSAIAGQLADLREKTTIIRAVKGAEIGIMAIGAIGLTLASQGKWTDAMAIPLMLLALFAMGIHSTFFGPIKYAILPQHLRSQEVLAGTGLVEAGTYVAIMGGTILAGFISAELAAIFIVLVAVLGFLTSLSIPLAPPTGEKQRIDYNPLRSSAVLLRNMMRNREVYLAILAISFFWTIGAVLFIQFPPLAKNVLFASKEVASLFLVVFSVGIAIGSVAINALLKGKVTARYSSASVLGMAAMVVIFYMVCLVWQASVESQSLMDIAHFIAQPLAWLVLGSLLFIAIFGGMFVVPLYAFLTTRVDKSEASRTIAANNIFNSGAMVGGSLLALALSFGGVPLTEQLLLSAAMCLISAWLGWQLYRAEQPDLPI